MTAFAGQWGPEPFVDRDGTPVPDVVVTVYPAAGGPLADLWADRDRAVALANPLPRGVGPGVAGVDVNGNAILFAEPARYLLVATVAGSEVYRSIVAVDVDPTEDADTITGGGGAEGDVTFPSQVWLMPHNLGFHPGIRFWSGPGRTGSPLEPAATDHPTLDLTTATWLEPRTGSWSAS